MNELGDTDVAIHPSNNFISLFAGAGGLDLAVGLALPDARCVCYVEREIEAAEILEARIKDKALDDAPIWSDVSTFDGKPWRGLVDGIVGGFPCQDLSVAGKRAGIQRGNRSGLFDEYMRIATETDAAWMFIENVEGLLTTRTLLHRTDICEFYDAAVASVESAQYPKERYYAEFHRERLQRRLLDIYGIPSLLYVLCRLEEMGYRYQVGLFSAEEVGASHQRKRCFLLAYRRCGTDERWGATLDLLRAAIAAEGEGYQRQWNGLDAGDCSTAVAYSDGSRQPQCSGDVGEQRNGAFDGSERVADSGCDAVRRCAGCGETPCRRSCIEVAGSGAELGNADDSRLEGRRQLAGERGDEWSAGAAGGDMGFVFAPGPTAEIWNDVLVRDYGMRPALSQAEAESCLRRVADGLASPLDQRIDRLRACGNGVVAIQGAAALIELVRRIDEEL